MSTPPKDPFTTNAMQVPNLVALMKRLRDDTIRNSITVLHTIAEGEGEWILATAAARLARAHVRTAGPEPVRPADLVEHAVRSNAKVVLIGEIRRDDDARALRAAASLNIRTVAVITAPTRLKADHVLTMLGPWNNFDVALLSIHP